jgi:hypothetical protein
LFDDDKDIVGECEVIKFGEIGAVDGHALLYGLYVYNTAASDFIWRTSVVVYERCGDVVRALFAPMEGDGAGEFYDVPIIGRADDASTTRFRGRVRQWKHRACLRVAKWKLGRSRHDKLGT